MVAVTERLVVDVDALRNGGVNIDRVSSLALRISGELIAAAERYHHAGGSGEMGEKFQQGYRPGAEQGIRFVTLLRDAIGEVGGRTVSTAKSFATTSDDADGAVRG